MIGEFTWRKRGRPWQRQHNVITTQGREWYEDSALLLSTSPQLYCAPFAGIGVPDATWNAATFPSGAAELTSGTEGYAEATRQPWTAVSAFQGQIDANNFISESAKTGAVTQENVDRGAPTYLPMSFRIKTASTLSVYGFGMLTVATKGATTGVLFSAMRFAAAPEVYEHGDILDIYYALKHEQ